MINSKNELADTEIFKNQNKQYNKQHNT